MNKIGVLRQAPEAAEHPVPQIDTGLCDGCGRCVQACPAGALGLINGVAAVVRAEACDYHGRCVQICPRQAITRFFQIILAPPPHSKNKGAL